MINNTVVKIFMSEKIILSDLITQVQKAIRYIFSQYVLLLKISMLTSIIALGYWYLQSDKFQADATFIVEEKSGSKTGLGALASQVGFDLGSLTGGNAGLFEGDNILDIMQSRLIVEKVLLSKIDSTRNGATETLADLYVASHGLKKKWSKYPSIAKMQFGQKATTVIEKLQQDSLLFVVFEEVVKNHLVVKRQNKKGSIINIQVVSNNQIFSKLFTERLS